ncbi:MAG: saccharopine dehydrogenase NADP-binding domain-containing protein [SAR324 cluster bacterium]|nr:saccharopine dehydrogenase NADP-binding domain-containing protein [SAR324 cluster bacterium]
MEKVVIVGSGKIGAAIAKLLYHSQDYDVLVVDAEAGPLAQLKKSIPVKTRTLDITDRGELLSVLKGRKRVMSACPYTVNPLIAEVALEAGISYFDLTEDRETTEAIRAVAEKARPGQVFMPQCGLAPGYISILASDTCREFETLDQVKMRVGALPQFPSNTIMYNLTWSTDGLINEYCNPCQSIDKGRLKEVQPLEGIELFSLDGVNYEAFNTSGGLGTLCETLDGKVYNLNYKTVRYQGHQYLMGFLINSLRLGDRREILKDILETAIPVTMQDVVLVFVSVAGWKNDQLLQVNRAYKIYHQTLFGEPWSSIQLTTSSGACAAMDLFTQGVMKGTGFIKQESVPLDDFLANRFGSYYKKAQNLDLSTKIDHPQIMEA